MTDKKLELHYFLNDQSHSMNATVRNECEKELLLIFKHIISSLDLEIEIESEAFSEGGLKEFWKLIGKNSPQITLILVLLTIYLSRIPVENKKLVELQIENLTLDNEIKKKELKKINHNVTNENQITQELVEKIITELDSDYKLIWHKSSFYKKLSFYPKVNKISTQILDINNKPLEKENTVLRSEFSKFVLHSNKIAPFMDEEAMINIISPVLIKGNFRWKGFYKNQIIGFEMKDQEFKSSVINKQINFVNGIAIKCVLQVNREIDETGTIQNVNTQVLTVFEVIDGTKILETEQGKKYHKEKILNDQQIKFVFE